MNSGFVTKRREEQLWEVQRIITQLKRKLRQEKKSDPTTQKSIEDTVDSGPASVLQPEVNTNTAVEGKIEAFLAQSLVGVCFYFKSSSSGAYSCLLSLLQSSPTLQSEELSQATRFTISDSGFLVLPPSHPDNLEFMKLQLENYELNALRQRLQSAINEERAEIHALKKELMTRQAPPIPPPAQKQDEDVTEIDELWAQNQYLETVRKVLCNEILAEHNRIVDLRVQCLMQGVGD